MPLHAPIAFTPGPWACHNGQPARSSHAIGIDRYTAWLTAVQRHAVPALIGSPMVAGTTYSIRTQLPHYCAGVGIGLYAAGEGYVDVGCGDDPWLAQLPVVSGQSTGVEYADWVWAMLGIDAVVADGLWRALDTTDQASPHEVTIALAPTDGATLACVVHAVILAPLPHDPSIALP